MQKVSAIIFLSVMLVSQTPLQQVLKLPVLIEHFREHQKEGKETSFISFIELHYFSGNPKDKDYDRDQQLPFRSDAVVVFDSSVDIPVQNFKVDPLPLYKEKTYPLFDISSLPGKHGFDIWQPPKSC
jgi:hypothetical protein